MPLVPGSIAALIIQFINESQGMVQEDLNLAIIEFGNNMENAIFTAIQQATVTIPPGAIVTTGSPTTQSNPAPAIGFLS